MGGLVNSNLIMGNKSIMKQLKDVNPKFAKHILLKNQMVERFALQEMGSMEMLEHPMCGKCERPGTWHTDDTCYHMSCGTVTKKPITMREYLLEHMKIPIEMLEMMEQHAYGEGGEEIEESIITK